MPERALKPFWTALMDEANANTAAVVESKYMVLRM